MGVMNPISNIAAVKTSIDTTKLMEVGTTRCIDSMRNVPAADTRITMSAFPEYEAGNIENKRCTLQDQPAMDGGTIFNGVNGGYLFRVRRLDYDKDII